MKKLGQSSFFFHLMMSEEKTKLSRCQELKRVGLSLLQDFWSERFTDDLVTQVTTGQEEDKVQMLLLFYACTADGGGDEMMLL